MFTGKYGVAKHFYINISKAGSANHAVGADWTPAAGDVKISKDGGAAANVTNLPTSIAMGNSAIWDFSLTATEMQAAQINITIADSVTKAVDDTGFVIGTFGNASANLVVDFSNASLSANVAQILGTTLTETSAGYLAAAFKKLFDIAVPVLTSASVNQTGDSYAIANSGTFGNSALKALIDTVATYVDTEVAAIKAKTDNLPTDPADASDIAASFSTVNGTLATIATYIDTEVAAIKAKTDNLPTDPADASDIAASFGTVNSTLATIAGYIDTEISTIISNIAALNNLSAAQVNAEVVDALATDTYAELAAVPAATSSLKDKINWLFALARNKVEQTATTQTLKADNGTTTIATSTVSDDATTFTRGEFS